MARSSDSDPPGLANTARPELSDLTHSVFEEVLHTIRTPIFIVRPDGQVLWMNRRGRALVASAVDISLANGRLRGDTVRRSGEIHDLIKEVVDRGPRQRSRRAIQAISLPGRSGERPLRLVAIGLTGDDAAAPQTALSALFVGDLDRHRIASPRLLMKLLGLTPAEAKIAAGLADGLSIDDLASELGVGIGTVRWHVKRAMANTDTRRQGELIRLVLLTPLALIAA